VLPKIFLKAMSMRGSIIFMAEPPVNEDHQTTGPVYLLAGRNATGFVTGVKLGVPFRESMGVRLERNTVNWVVEPSMPRNPQPGHVRGRATQQGLYLNGT
jgi:hypothetical protein